MNSIDNIIHQISSRFELEPVLTQLKLGISDMHVDTDLINREAKLGNSFSPQYFTVDSSWGVNPQFPIAKQTNKDVNLRDRVR